MPYPDLTTTTAVRAFAGKPSADTAQDAIIASLISRASLLIMRWTEREFVTNPSLSTEREFEVELTRDGFMELAPYDAQAETITLVELDTDISTPRTLSADEWRAWPIPAKDGVVSALRLIPISFGGFHRFRHRRIRITATWGWPSVPADVEHATIITVLTWLKRDSSAFSTTFKLDEGVTERPEVLPSAVRALLAHYRTARQG